eukprot:comp23932_c11_seq1/m.42272 comp23932_c11_seq1/g.42272  ORF comp23932_c11_seq1/g.42272 comp23932_c11_seq1/m.42272 type:complete len:468 (-) comp23932_c11_seq1:387-1790(-)
MSELGKSVKGGDSSPDNLALDVFHQQANPQTGSSDDLEHDLSKRKAHVFGSAANLTTITVGPGILSLPAAFGMVGWLTGSVLMVVGGIGAWAGLHLLSEIAHRIGGTRTSFGKAAAKAGPVFAILADIAVAMNQLMAGVPYIMVVGDLMPLVVQTFNSDISHDSVLLSRRFWISVVLWGICCPLCLLPTTNALRYTSTMAMGSMVYIAVLAMVYFARPPVDVLDRCAGVIGVCKGPIEATTPFSTSFIKSLSTFFFAFNCHPLLFNIYNEIREPSVKFMDKVLAVWGCFVSTIYALFGLGGYFTYGSNVRSNVLKNWPLSTPATIGRLALCFSVTVSFPLLMQSARIVIMHLVNLCLQLGGRKDLTQPTHKLQTWLYWGSCIVHLAFACLVALFVTDLGVVFSLVGATGAALTCYIIPGLMYWKLFKDDRKEREISAKEKFVLYAALCIGIFGVVYVPVGVASVFIN